MMGRLIKAFEGVLTIVAFCLSISAICLSIWVISNPSDPVAVRVAGIELYCGAFAGTLLVGIDVANGVWKRLRDWMSEGK